MRHKRTIVAVCVLMLSACASSPGTRSAKSANTSNANAAELQVKLGQGYMEQGDYEVALEKLRRAIELDPGSADAQTVIAVLYEQIGRRELAEKHYRRSVELKPEAGMMLNNFGGFLCRTGRYDESIVQFTKALDDPFYRTPEAALANAGSCARQAGRADQAEQFYREALKRKPEDASVLLDMADMMFRAGNFMSARAFMQRYQSLGSPTAQALALAVRIERGLGDKPAADRYLDELRRVFPDSNVLNELQDQDQS